MIACGCILDYQLRNTHSRWIDRVIMVAIRMKGGNYCGFGFLDFLGKG